MNRLLTAAVAAAALWAAACSPGHTTITPPPPAGNFTAASLSGTYAFVTSGEVTTSSSSSTPLSRTGSFVADGRGNITGGVYDVVNSGGFGTTPAQPNPITGGTYTVNSDGRGTLTLNVNSGGTPGSINFGFVLTTGSSGTSAATNGLMIDETSNSSQASTGSGNLVLQNTSQFGISFISGPYVFDFSGVDASGSASESLVGQFSATTGGAIASAVEDSNDGGALNSGAIVAGPFAADTANMTRSGRGTVNIAGQTYAFYIVDSTHVRFISSNASGTGPMLTGDALSQSTGLPGGPTSISASFAFLVAGSSANGGGGLTRVGRFTVTNGTLSKILVDVNNNFNESELTNLSNGSIAFFDQATGRGTLTFSNSTTTYSFVFYLSSPSSGVIQETTGSAGSALVVADGTIAAQTGGPFTSSNISGNYAMNWSGLVFSGASGGFADEEDLVSLGKISNLSLTGTSDYFQFTSTTLTPNLNAGTGGQITINGDGTSNNSMAVSLSNTSAIHMVVYIVSPQLAFFENSDNSGTQRIVVGILQAQQ